MDSEKLAPSTRRVLYRLSSLVCHYGGHAFGHYIAYRRKPAQSILSPVSSESKPQVPLTLTDSQPGTGRGWLRISDDNVEEVGIERVLGENGGTFMLFYERMEEPHTPKPEPRPEPGPSAIKVEEDVRPSFQIHGRASTPRIVRSVSAGIVRDRKQSLTPMSLTRPSTPSYAAPAPAALSSSPPQPFTTSHLTQSPPPSPRTSRDRDRDRAKIPVPKSPPPIRKPNGMRV